MTDKEFKAEIKRGLSGGYFLYGEEEYVKSRLLTLAVRSVIGDDDFSSVNLIENDENSYTDSFLEDAISTMPMMSDRCAAVCRVRFSELKQSGKENIYSALSLLADNPQTVLFLVIPSGFFDEGALKKGKPSSEYKALSEYLTPVAFPYQTASVLKNWCERRLAQDGVGASPDALDALVDAAGPEMSNVASECEKLACFALSKGLKTVTANDVSNVCSVSGELDAFALSNAVVSGNRDAALSALKECRDKRQKASAVASKMTGEFMNMYSVALCMKDGMLKSEIAKRLSIHEFRVGKYMEALRDTDAEAVRAVISRCVDADAALKSSGGGYDVLERFVCTIPSKRRNGGYR